MESVIGGSWGTCLYRCATQEAARDCHPGLKRLIRLPCLDVLPVQPYENMGSVLIEYD
jgi:hypothetical protein